MPTIRKRAVKGRELTREQGIELWIGPGGRTSAFANNRERKEAWLLHRDEMLEEHPKCRRPWGWWFYERGMTSGVTGRDMPQYLLDNNCTTPEERQLIEQWRNADEEAQRGRAQVDGVA
jgi:hypothetical protein